MLVVVAASFAHQPRHINAVPDEVTAVKIAERVLTGIYGKKIIDSEKPFTATLTKGVWHVGGTLYCNDEHGVRIAGAGCRGGVAMAEIKQSNGRILRTEHGR